MELDRSSVYLPNFPNHTLAHWAQGLCIIHLWVSRTEHSVWSSAQLMSVSVLFHHVSFFLKNLGDLLAAYCIKWLTWILRCFEEMTFPYTSKQISTHWLTGDTTLIFPFLTCATLPSRFDSSALCSQAAPPPDHITSPNPACQARLKGWVGCEALSACHMPWWPCAF